MVLIFKTFVSAFVKFPNDKLFYRYSMHSLVVMIFLRMILSSKIYQLYATGNDFKKEDNYTYKIIKIEITIGKWMS